MKTIFTGLCIIGFIVLIICMILLAVAASYEYMDDSWRWGTRNDKENNDEVFN